MVDVSVIIVSYNSSQHLVGLLDSLGKTKGLSLEVIVVDNASADDSVAVARRHKVKPRVIKNQNNVGFSRAVNQGLREAMGEYIFLLNPDTRLVGDCVKRLRAFARAHRPIGAVVPRLVDPQGTNQASAFRFPTITNALRRYFLGASDRYGKYLPPQKTTTVDVAVMAAFFVPKEVFDQVGYLDERFFLYYEDIEFCRRLKRASLPIHYFPAAKVMHVHGASGSFRSHHESPLLKSAITYHGSAYFKVLNLVLWLGQKFDTTLMRFHLR